MDPDENPDGLSFGQPSTVHRCPPHGESLTPCCGRTPFELPRTERITVDDLLVTCGRASR